MASVLKTEEVKASGGSNPSPSARQQGAANAAPCLPPLQVRDRRNNVTRPRLRRTAAVPSPLPAAPYESLTFRQSEDKGASCALSSCLGLYLKPHPFTFRQRQRGVKQRPAVFLCCGMGICKRSATICKIEVPGPCGPDTPNVCKKPFCVCKIDVVMLRSAARGGLPKSETTFPLPRGAALMRVRGRKGCGTKRPSFPFLTIYQSSCAI